jgi:hypothetical protein
MAFHTAAASFRSAQSASTSPRSVVSAPMLTQPAQALRPKAAPPSAERLPELKPMKTDCHPVVLLLF